MNTLLLEPGVELPIASRIALTLQDNDLARPESVQVPFSTDFTLPDTVEVRAALGHVHAGTSASDVPYQRLRGVIRSGGVEVLPRALVTVREYVPGVGFTCAAIAGNLDFYDRLGDASIRALDLSDFDHDWSPGDIAAAALRTTPDGWAGGYTYDLYDRGHHAAGDPAIIDTAKLEDHGVWPSTWTRMLFERIVAGVGLRWSGTLPAMFDRELLPSTAPAEYGEQTRAACSSVVGLRMPGKVRKGEWGPEVIPYGYVTTGPFSVGADVDFNTGTSEARIAIKGYYRLTGSLSIAMKVGFATVKFRIDLEVNGVSVANAYVTTSNTLNIQLLTVTHGRILLSPGDVVRVTARGEKIGLTTDPRWLYPIVEGQVWPGQGPIVPPLPDVYPGWNGQKFAVELLPDFPIGGRIRLADWLPDLSQKDFVKSLLARYGLTQTLHPYADEVIFRPTAPVATAPAADWTERVDASRRPRRAWVVGDYTQRNWFRWLADAANPADAAGWGDGVLTSPAGLNADSDAVTLPFAASPVGAEDMLLIPYWKPRAGTVPTEYDTQQPAPRLTLLTDRRRIVTVDDQYGTTEVASLPLAEFQTLAGDDLDFARTLLPAYYPHLAAVLRRPLALTIYVRLSPADVAAFDQLTPIWLAGEGHGFYVNKVDQFEADAASTTVELLRLTPA